MKRGMLTALSSEAKLLRLANALIRSGYEDFFQTLVNELALVLDVDYVMIAAVPEASHQATTLAVSFRGESADNILYDLHGTPCETVPERELCQYPESVSTQFPDDKMLQDFGIQSYCGMPVLTSSCEKLGILIALAKRPVKLGEADQEIMRIAAAQIGANMELARNQHRIQSLIFEDAVTGLANRRRILDWLDETPGVQSVILLDIKRFKDINDLHGHLIGDAVLYAVGERLKSRVSGLGFLGRLSSDEYVIIPFDEWSGTVLDQARQIQQWFEPSILSGSAKFQIGITIGAATASQLDGQRFRSVGYELLRRAGVSLAEAKALGQSVLVFESSMVDSRQYRKRMFDRLSDVLREGGLSLHYQPQIDLRTGELVGAEVLCRWHDAEMGWVPPGQFIRLAEERGLIIELGDWVLRESCRQLHEWDASGTSLPGKLCINISTIQLESRGFAERVLTILAGRDPSGVVFELTETAMMRAPEISIRQMERIRASGFSWAIDDFGTGYSSLAFLTRVHAQFLKIDKSFVSRVPNSRNDETVIRTIVAMAESLGMNVIAEGVETQEQLAFLKSIDCCYAQGYHLGHPLDPVSFKQKWLA
ncbi:bifunctional diguanylate cyclase/phosphodiesterase [Orrella marina]|uniref:Histidine kinase n=1 Tax=Orrella marina TaxID=2163011 RepID=A0A2R4XFC9_9BURK|nr:bifunctional diguanylate cyclase/phosphodiesterase [Orrella marina]AWB32516.1 histidine kinase [Orrella marina]